MKNRFVEIGIKDKLNKEVYTCKVKEGDEIFYSIGDRYIDTNTMVNAVYLFESNLELFFLPEHYNSEEINKEFFKRYEQLDTNYLEQNNKSQNKKENSVYSNPSILGYNKNKKKVRKYEYQRT